MIRNGTSIPAQMGVRTINGASSLFMDQQARSRFNTQFPNMRTFSGGDAEDVSFPEGLNDLKAIELPYIDSCSMAVTLYGEGFVSTQAQTSETVAATLPGDGSLSIAAQIGLTMSATLTGDGSLTASGRTIESIAVTMDAGARPSSNDIAQAVWSTLIEAGFTASAIMKFVGAMAAGDATGLESGSPDFKKLSDNTQTRMSGTYSAGTRTISTKDIT